MHPYIYRQEPLRSTGSELQKPKATTKSNTSYPDLRQSAAQQRKRQEQINQHLQQQPAAQLQARIDSRSDYTLPGAVRSPQGGLPAQLQSGIEQLSGLPMDDVRVHYNSSKPAQLQAHAYAQGRDIHLAPGQERHLPHEAWHVVQQKQGRVKPTLQMKSGTPVNDEAHLEREADVMGARAVIHNPVSKPALQAKATSNEPVAQLVKAYRVEYQYNRKVAVDEKSGVSDLKAPIDISFVKPDHSEYFAAERKPSQLVGLRVVEWEMDDNWWAAVMKMVNGGSGKLNGKANAYYSKMKGKLPNPAWSDGASLVKFVKKTALHFQEQWHDSLKSAIKKGRASVTDLEQEYYNTIMEALEDNDLVWAYLDATEEDREDESFDEADYGPETGSEMKKSEADLVDMRYMTLEQASSLGYIE